MNILLTGSSGLLGTALGASLRAAGHSVVPLTRGGNAPCWQPEANTIDLSGAGNLDAAVHLAGDNIARGRWNARKKARIRDSRVLGTRLLSEALAAMEPKPRVFVSASAIGYYGSRGDAPLDETSPGGDDFLAEVCRAWEDAAAPAAEAGIRVAHARAGMILDTNGGALKKMLTPFRMGLGGIVGDGTQYMSWVHMDDALGIFQHLLENDTLAGPVNVVSPCPVRNREFTRALGAALHRPTLFPLPAFAARMAFGEMADALLLSSARVAPAKLMASGYVFQHPKIRDALSKLLA